LPELCRLARRLEAHEQHFADRLREAKLSALKEFAYGAGHEINNPLANIASRAQSLLGEETHPERRRKLAAINAQAFRAHEMLADLMLFARPPALRCEGVDLRVLVSEALGQLGPAAQAQGTRLELIPVGRAIQAWADPVQLRVALAALVQNAVEALGGGGQVTVELAERETDWEIGVPRRRWACVAVGDNGPGIAPADVGRIFDPFYSGREAGRGLGFGLPKCWRIAAEHRGRLEVESEFGRGATFRLWLPGGPTDETQSSDGA
jgi:signal transduction histidine kinase